MDYFSNYKLIIFSFFLNRETSTDVWSSRPKMMEDVVLLFVWKAHLHYSPIFIDDFERISNRYSADLTR